MASSKFKNKVLWYLKYGILITFICDYSIVLYCTVEIYVTYLQSAEAYD